LPLGERLPELPVHSREAVEQELATLDFLETQIEAAEERWEAIMKVSAEADLLKTLPCVGNILSMVMMLEIGREALVTSICFASFRTITSGRVETKRRRTVFPSLVVIAMYLPLRYGPRSNQVFGESV
jgi:transposase